MSRAQVRANNAHAQVGYAEQEKSQYQQQRKGTKEQHPEKNNGAHHADATESTAPTTHRRPKVTIHEHVHARVHGHPHRPQRHAKLQPRPRLAHHAHVVPHVEERQGLAAREEHKGVAELPKLAQIKEVQPVAQRREAPIPNAPRPRGRGAKQVGPAAGGDEAGASRDDAGEEDRRRGGERKVVARRDRVGGREGLATRVGAGARVACAGTGAGGGLDGRRWPRRRRAEGADDNVGDSQRREVHGPRCQDPPNVGKRGSPRPLRGGRPRWGQRDAQRRERVRPRGGEGRPRKGGWLQREKGGSTPHDGEWQAIQVGKDTGRVEQTGSAKPQGGAPRRVPWSRQRPGRATVARLGAASWLRDQVGALTTS